MPGLFARLIELKIKYFKDLPADIQQDIHIALSKNGYDDNGNKLLTA